MPRASDIQVDRNNSILFKGPTGFGKTLAAATFALEGEVFLAYWDKKGPIELRNFFRRMGDVGVKILNNINYEIYSARNAEQFLNKLIDFAENCRLAAFVNDSVTQMTAGAVNWSMGFRPDRENKNKLKVIPGFDEYKVETSLVTQSLDICKSLPCHVIWTAHPLPGIQIEGEGRSMKVTKVNPIVTYGSKVAGIIPGNFSEIYHFTKQNNFDPNTSSYSRQFRVIFDGVIGDELIKSNIGLTGDIDITFDFKKDPIPQLFYTKWREKIKLFNKEVDDAIEKQRLEAEKKRQEEAEKSGTANLQFPDKPAKKWNSEKGVYE